MTPSDRKRFLFINFTMGQMNEYTDDIYEALADNDAAGVSKGIADLMAVCEHLQESISDEKVKTEAKP